MSNSAFGSRPLLLLSIATLSFSGLISWGCGGANKKTSQEVSRIGGSESLTIPRVDPTLCDTKGKKITTFDLNHDNRPDVWKLYATSDEGGTSVEILTCKQVDFDHDGKMDYVQTYSRTGEMIAEEIDLGFKGSIDAREHYNKKTGKIYLIERDSDHDSKPDVWEKYDKEGRLESVRRDRNADGKPDLWEQYENGVLLAILYDDDFDNKVDRKDEVKLPPKAKTPKKSDATPPADEGTTAPKSDPPKSDSPS